MIYPKNEIYTGRNYLIVDSSEIENYPTYGRKPVYCLSEQKTEVPELTDKEKKERLEEYAKEKFGVDLDKRKSLANLEKEVEALANGND